MQKKKKKVRLVPTALQRLRIKLILIHYENPSPIYSKVMIAKRKGCRVLRYY